MQRASLLSRPPATLLLAVEAPWQGPGCTLSCCVIAAKGTLRRGAGTGNSACPGAPGQQPLPGHTWRCCCPGEALQPHGCGASFQGSLAACGLSCSWSRSTVADSCSGVFPPHSSAPQPSLIREAGTSPAAKLNHLVCVFGHARPLTPAWRSVVGSLVLQLLTFLKN